MRKEWIGLVAGLAFASLTGCSASSDTPAAGQEPSSVVFDSVSTHLDYAAITENVGPIASVSCWTEPEQIPVREILGWYLRYYAELYSDADDPFATYRRADDPDLLHIGAADFEQAAMSFFGTDSEYLRNESGGFYDEASNEYIVPETLKQASISCTVRSSELSGDLVQVQFDLTSQTLGQKSYLLSIDLQNGMRFKSCQEILESSAANEEEKGE